MKFKILKIMSNSNKIIGYILNNKKIIIIIFNKINFKDKLNLGKIFK